MEQQLSRLVRERAVWGLDFAAGCFGDGDVCPTLVTYGANRKPLAIVNLETTEQIEEVVKATIDFARRTAVTDKKVHSYVLWWDSFLTLDGDRTDAVICEVGVRKEASAFLFAQRYRREGGVLVKIGEPTLLGPVEQQWTTPPAPLVRRGTKKRAGRKKSGSK
jgi:hypothetical protein